MDEVTRRRIAAVLLVIVVIVAALAIADLGPFSDPPTEEERAQETVEDFFGAAADGDFKEFCDLLSETASGDDRAARPPRSPRSRTCAAARSWSPSWSARTSTGSR